MEYIEKKQAKMNDKKIFVEQSAKNDKKKTLLVT